MTPGTDDDAHFSQVPPQRHEAASPPTSRSATTSASASSGSVLLPTMSFACTMVRPVPAIGLVTRRCALAASWSEAVGTPPRG